MFYPINKLCLPAYVYLVISLIILVVMGFQNLGNSTEYCAGSYSCSVSSTVSMFIMKVVYVAFWTWVLNLMCKSGASVVAWALVVLPILMMFLLIGGYLISGGIQPIPSSQSGLMWTNGDPERNENPASKNWFKEIFFVFIIIYQE